MEYSEIEEIVKKCLSEKRYKHSVGVAKRAAELAKIYGEDVEIARKIGIAHDVAKEMPKEEGEKYIKENGIILDEIEREQPGIWHSKIGADISMKKFGFTKEMAEAILYHTTGNINMNTMDKIIYIADKTEGNRTYKDLVDAIEISNRNIDEGVLYIAKVAIEYNIKKGCLIHPDTIYLINNIILKRNKSN